MPGNALAAIGAEPWMITRDALEQIRAIANREGDLQALVTRREQRLEHTQRAGVRDGIATLSITGPIMRYSSMFSDVSGLTSLSNLSTDFQAAVDNPTIRAILLNIDSPGGQVSGIAEFAEAIRAATKIKPVWAYGDDVIASAAYFICAAASRVVVSKTARVGSIGVMATLKTGADGDVIDIISSQSPLKNQPVTTDEGRAAMQAMVDRLAGVFVSDVARFRGKSEDQVLADFGRGGILFAPDAVAAGMADAVGSYENTFAELAKATSGSRRTTRSNTMTEPTGGDPKAVTYTQEQVDAAIATAKASAITGEAKRRDAIHALAQPGFEAELKAALDGGQSPEAFAMAVMLASKDRGITLGGMRNDAPPPAPHASAPTNPQAAKPGSAWEATVAKFTPK